MENKIIAVQWGDHYEESLYEMIDYMRECEGLDEDEIVGIVVELCEEAETFIEKHLGEWDNWTIICEYRK